MTRFHHDFETASEVDLRKCGLDVYARDLSTRPLMLGYAFDDEKPQIWFPHEGRMPADVRDAMRDPSVVRVAQNAQFERAIWKHVLGFDTPAESWRDTMIMAYALALPGDLDNLGRVLRLDQDQQKIADGKKLIRVFCVPHKTSKNQPHVWFTHETHPEEWARFVEYCLRDVIAEREIERKLSRFEIPDVEWSRWALDQRVNETGVPIDPQFVGHAIQMVERAKKALLTRMERITGLANPNSVAQLLPWAQERGYPFSEMPKDRVKKALSDFGDKLDPDCAKVLELRLSRNKTSVQKYKAMREACSEDGRLRYAFQFMGAGRTGRWAGRKVQLQNLPRPDKATEAHLAEARQIIRTGDYDSLEMLFDDPLLALSSSIRSAIAVPPGKVLNVADLSAIENRVLGWLARCDAILDVFRKGLDPYKSFGTRLYGKPYEAITKPERTNSKPPVLGAGYRLGGGTEVGEYPDTKKTGLWGYAESMGIPMTKDEAHRAVRVFRDTYPEVVQFWYDLEEAMMRALIDREPQRVGFVVFDVKPPFLRIRLPSGRYLYYLRPKIVRQKIKYDGGEFEKTGVTYEGYTPEKKWGRISTHGGKITENLCQAVARDVLVEGMEKADAAGFSIIGSVHDEIISLDDVADTHLNPQTLCDCMTVVPEWAPGLPLDAAGYASDFYRKD